MRNKSKIICLLSVLGFIFIATGLIIYRKEFIYYTELKQDFLKISNNYNKVELKNIIKKSEKLNKNYKKEITPQLNKYSKYIEITDLINKHYKNNILLTSTTSKDIQLIDKKYKKLDEKYKSKVKSKIHDIKEQFNNMKTIQEKINDLFQDSDKTLVKEEVTLELLEQYTKELNQIPQTDFVMKNQIYIETAKKEINDKITAAWVKLNVPYISQNKNNILNGCEAASMLMGLQYKGYLKEMTLQDYVKLMPLSENNNAEEGFTHDLYTLDPLTVPHWIAPEPLKKFGIDTSNNQNIINGTGMSIDDLDRELDNNNPVIIYLIAKFNQPKEVVEGAPRNLHVMLLTGYNKITKEHYIVDPWTHDDGRTSWTVSRELLEEKYNYVGKKAVIIR